MTELASLRQNLLLGALDEKDLAFLAPYLTRVPLEAGNLIAEFGKPITDVCFPECGVTSIADVRTDGSRIEIAVIGREGVTNLQLLLDSPVASHEAVVQIGGGTALQLAGDHLRELCVRSPSAQALFLRFVHILNIQTARTVSSNLRDSAQRRLSRWLLMCHDRIDGDEIKLRHENIGRMLGVRRATVTDTLHILEGDGALKNRRGCILIRNRILLEELASESYGFAEDQYRQLIGPFGKVPVDSE